MGNHFAAVSRAMSRAVCKNLTERMRKVTMSKKFKNIDTSPWEERGSWRFMDLSGDHLGVRIEEVPPGGSSSIHHYHTQEEEHVLVLEGEATLVLGTEEHRVVKGDHCWFQAANEEAHHIENRTSEPFRFLVFGERKSGDVVVYPENKVMMVKALKGWKQFDYEQRDSAIQDE